jgi:hypothetical protein
MQRVITHLAAAERLSRLRPPFPASGWSPEQFRAAAGEGRRRWAESEQLFGAQWPMFDDAVAVISPSFGMESRFTEVAEAAVVLGRRNVNNRIALWFMKWAHCPVTAEYPNPYEPWIEIWENGGSFSVEHGQFVDIYDASGMPVGAIVVRRA